MKRANACAFCRAGTHKVFTGVCLVLPNGNLRQTLVETRLRFERLSRLQINAYLSSGEWRGKAGGYAIQGLAGSFVRSSLSAPIPMWWACPCRKRSGFSPMAVIPSMPIGAQERFDGWQWMKEEYLPACGAR
ncbi:Maf family protein [Brucella abortus]|nr:Maf family protein [Brucella abortus]